MARDARALLADMRALGEQNERKNPLSGRNMLNRTQFPVATDEEPYPMTGSGATPSMGLSQFRGGAKEVGRKLGQILREKKGAAYHKDFMEGCGDLMITHKDESSSGEEECAPCGAGTKKGQTRKTARKAFEGGAKRQMGKEAVDRAIREANEIAEGFSAAATLAQMKKSGRAPTRGERMKDAAEEENAAKTLVSMKEKKKGGLGTGAYEGHGAGDKRKARGAAVSKLMKEKGMSLAEASKHIKEHGY